MAKCLVLGANGFIGSHLVDALVADGHEVRVFDRLNGQPRYLPSKAIERVYGDFLNKDDLIKAVDGMEYVFHLISTTTPASAENDPLIDIETNIRMSVELFSICAEKEVKRIVFASTGGSIYGEGGGHAKSELDLPQPISPYAIGKLTIEQYLRYFKVKRGLDSIVFRISNPYGERQALHAKQGVIPIFLENIISGCPLTILGDGSMVRDYMYVKDVAETIAAIFDKPARHEIYNLGSGTPVTVNDIVEAVTLASGEKPKLEYHEVPATFIHTVTLNTERIEKEFGVTAKTSLSDGVAATYTYVKEALNNEQ